MKQNLKHFNLSHKSKLLKMAVQVKELVFQKRSLELKPMPLSAINTRLKGEKVFAAANINTYKIIHNIFFILLNL